MSFSALGILIGIPDRCRRSLFKRYAEMKKINVCMVLLVSSLTTGCFGFVPTNLAPVKATLEYWEKPGMTSESRLADSEHVVALTPSIRALAPNLSRWHDARGKLSASRMLVYSTIGSVACLRRVIVLRRSVMKTKFQKHRRLVGRHSSGMEPFSSVPLPDRPSSCI